MDGVNLVVVTGLKAVVRDGDKILLTKKFIEGMALYKEFWKGPITLVCEPTNEASNNLDNVELDIASAPFKTVIVTSMEEGLHQALNEKSIVLSSVGFQFNNVSTIAASKGIPAVYVSEYSLETRLQIVREVRNNPIHAWWSSRWERQQEKAQIRAISLAAGIQCNGTPTFNAYKDLTSKPLLFFDTRTTRTMMASEQAIKRKFETLSGRSLHLIFSGRLSKMKGVDDIPRVAAILKRSQVPFRFTICGDGDCLESMKKSAGRLGVGADIEFMGILDFKSELVPFVAEHADLFVCCHRQGDPSCTYMETMACGVPIVGYNNEAFRGLVETAGTGWIVGNMTPAAMAEAIRHIYRKPALLMEAAKKSLKFAQRNAFEDTFKRRIEHLEGIVSASR